MTTQEFSHEFDILYNNIKSNAAPGLDEYEKSVFLTDAQDQIVTQLYLSGSFEATELTRRHLDNLKRQSVLITPTQNVELASSSNSWFFTLPPDVRYIVRETVELTEPDCPDNKTIDVLPMREDEFNTQIDNPFRKPSLKKRTKTAWRLDYSDVPSTRKVEIVGPDDYAISKYIIRYIKKPRPIITQVLTDIATNLSIDGLTAISQCELDETTHRFILKLAVQSALKAYVGLPQEQQSN